MVDIELYRLLTDDNIENIEYSNIDNCLIISVDAFDVMQNFKYNIYQFMIESKNILKEKYHIYVTTIYNENGIEMYFKYNEKWILDIVGNSELELYFNGLQILKEKGYIKER